MMHWTGGARLRAVLGGAMLLWQASCAGSGSNDCNDGTDNDADGLIDSNDPGCVVNGNKEAPDPDFPACADSVDNDGDGLSDFPDDPGCVSPDDDDEYNRRVAKCRDGIDNDDDGRIDFPNDPGCFLPNENDEEDDCPDGANCPECANEVDDDDDGLIDYGGLDTNDPGCDRAADDNEFNADPGICGNVELLPLPSDGIAEGDAQANAGNELISVDCGGSGQETVYTAELDEATALYITTDFPETTLDTVVYVRTECREPASELGCDDDTEGTSSTLLVSATPGVYYIIVDAHNAGSAGHFKVQVSEFIPEGEQCDPENPMCAPGLVCRLYDASADYETCLPPRCSDGMDNDGDSLSDTPDDPGCIDEEDNDETDDCPDGPDCPECGNEEDDDGDGLTDYSGGDPGCRSASDDNEIDECIPGVDVYALDPTGVSGTTGGSSNFLGSCGYGSYPEDVYSYKVTQDLLSITFSTVGSSFDTVTYVRYEECSNADAEVACEDPGSGGEEVVIPDPVNGGTYFIFVDGSYASGDYVLSAYGEIAGGDACDPADTQFICESGYYCEGTSETCEEAACNDDVDDDGDGDGTGYPEDPGCESISDNTEEDDCPDGATCPECANEEDDDGDGLIDWGEDPGCQAAGDDVEDDCPAESDGVEVIVAAATAGDTTGLTDDFTPSCASSSTAPDKVFILPVPGKLSFLRVDTEGSTLDTVISIKQSECGNPDLGCNDEGPTVPFGASEIELTDLDGGSYIIIVDGWGSYEGAFQLNVSGIVRAGEICNQAQIDAGIFECELGFACQGGVCSAAACNDGVDNDSPPDDKIDYPDDPGCESPSDADEYDPCATDPGHEDCPACSDTDDNDGDGLIDYGPDAGNDPGCIAASDDNEIDECIPGVEVMLLTEDGVTGTTPASTAGSNFVGSCHGSTTSTEDVYSYLLDATLSSLTFSTVGSTGDTVTHVRFGDCADSGAEVGCENEQNGGEEVTIADPDTGWYYVFVDGDYVSQIAYVLNVSGIIPAGADCTPGDPAFICELGYACPATTCVVAQCNDGTDNDGDGWNNADDPGCADASDDDEGDDTCADDPGTCPACKNTEDDDGDGLIDYPEDTGCENAADTIEQNCDDSDPILPFDSSPETGSTGTATHDYVPSCTTSSTPTAPDVIYELIVPGDLVSLEVNTNDSGYDTMLMIKQTSCTEPDLDCDDDSGDPGLQSKIVLSAVPAGVYFLIVDGYGTASGTYNLNVIGVIADGQACNPDQVTAGFMSCEGATSCTDPGGGYVCN